MSEFHVPVVRVGPVTKHPGADNLSLTSVFDYPVIMRTGEFVEGDLAAYVPVDAIVPKDEARWAFLADHRRIKAKRLRGVFSMGLLTKAPEGSVEGDDVREVLCIEKYEPAMDLSTFGDNEKDPGLMPVYTDIEGLRRWPGKLLDGEEVVLTEKIHGANARFVFDGERLWCGSRTGIKKDSPKSIWWEAARHELLADKLTNAPNLAFYGEVFGQVQDLKYDVPSGVRLRFFDVLEVRTRRYLDYDEALDTIRRVGLTPVPELYRGPWRQDLRTLAEGRSAFAACIREGFVVKPVKERFDGEPGPRGTGSHALGRVILKMVGQDYLLRKGG